MEGASIQVTNIRKSTSEFSLRLFFENKASSDDADGDIEHIDYVEGSGEAIITYKDPDMAQTVLNTTEPLMHEKCELSVKPYTLKKADPRKVQVKGIGPDTSEDFIKLYFSNKKYSAGGDIEDFQFFKDQGEAVITFKDPEVAQRVLSHPQKLDKVDLILEPYVEEEYDSRIIEVSGMKNSTALDTLSLFFSSPLKKYASGGEIDDIKYDQQNGKAIITFEEEEVAARVLERTEPIVLEGATLSVARYIEKQKKETLPLVLLFDGIKTSTSTELLKLFLESKRCKGGDIKTIDHRQKHGQAVVIYEEDSVAFRVLNQKEPVVFDGVTLKVSQHVEEDRPLILVIDGINKSTSTDLLKLFLESKHCQGGDIKSIDHKQGDGQALVTYEDESVAQRVLDQGQFSLEDAKLSVTRYVPSLEPRKLLVRGIGPNTKKDTVKMYFESKKVSNSAEVSEVEWCQDRKGEAIIQFSDPNVTDLVLTKKQLSLEGSELSVEPYTGKMEPTSDMSEECEVSNKVVVKGVNVDTTEDALSLFFESKNVGDGDVVSVEYKMNPSEDSKEAVVTFEDIAATERVLARTQPLRYEGATLAVSRFVPSQQASGSQNSDTIIVQGLSDSTTFDGLSLYFENPKTGGDIVSISHEPSQGTAIIRFADKKDVTKVLNNKEALKLDGKVLTISTVDPRIILVTDISPRTSKTSLKSFFESKKKCDGGEVEDVRYVPKSGKAIITFKEAAAATRVLGQSELVLDGATMTVSSYTPELADHSTKPDLAPTEQQHAPSARSLSVEVRGLNQSVTYLKLKKFLESQATIGDIKKIKISKSGTYAVVDYNRQEDADDILKKRKLQIKNGPEMTVVGIDTTIQRDGRYQGIHALSVLNFPDNKTIEEMRLFFKNKKVSGTNEIHDIHLKQDRTVVVTFSSYQAVEQVLNKKRSASGLKFASTELDVVLLEPPRPPVLVKDPCNRAKFILFNAPVANPEDFENFFTQATPSELSEILYSMNKGTVMLGFTFPPDYHSLLLHCCSCPLRGEMMTIQRAPLPTMVQVHNIQIDSDSLGLYFESSDSGGADLEIVEANSEEKWAVLDFSNHEVVQNVVSREHIFLGHSLEVFDYYPEFGLTPPDYDPTQPWCEAPEPIIVPLPDKYVFQFLSMRQSGKDLLEKTKEEQNFAVSWDKSGPDGLYVLYKQKSGSKGGPLDASVVKSWKEDVLKNLNDTFGEICVEAIPTVSEIFPMLSKEVKIHMDNDDFVCIKESSKFTVILVGLNMAVQAILCNIKSKVKMEEDSLNYAKKSTKESIDFKDFQMAMMKETKALDSIQQSYPNLEIVTSNKCTLEFSGIPSDIKSARLDLYDNVVTKICSQELPVPTATFDFLDNSLVQSKLNDEFQDPKHAITPATMVVRSGSVILATLDSNNVRKMERILMDNILDKKIPLEDNQQHVVKDPQWDALCDQHKSDPRLVGLYKQKMTDDKIEIIGLAHVVHEIAEKLETFLTEHTILERELPVEAKRVAFILDHHQTDIKQIEQNFKSSKVNIIPFTDRTGFIVKGTKHGIQNATKALDTVTSKILTQDHPVTQPWMIKQLESDVGQSFLNMIEKSHKVKLELVDADDRGALSATTCFREQLIHEIKLKNGCVVKMYRGDLTAHVADAIVNAANVDLDHCGGLAMAIVDQGGRSIQDECRRHIQYYGRILPGNVFVSQPGTLPCKRIVHAVGPEYKNGSCGEEAELFQAIYESLEVIDKEGFGSIALPAVSTGIFGYPLRDAIKVIVDAIVEFLEKSPTHLKEVHFMDDKPNVVNTFKEVILPKVQNIKAGEWQGAAPRISRQISSGASRGARAASPRGSGNNQPAAFKLGPSKDSIETHQGLVVKLVKGSIVTEKVDVLVNTTSDNFDLSTGAVSQAIVEVAGPSIQDECTEKAKAGVPLGELVETSGGKISGVKAIYHGAFPGWNNTSNCIQTVRTFIKRCLVKAGRFNSIAIPAIGTGNLNYPRDQVAECLFEQILEFSKQSAIEKLRDVRIVVYDKDVNTIQVFEKYMKKLTSGISAPSSPKKEKEQQQATTPRSGNRKLRRSLKKKEEHNASPTKPEATPAKKKNKGNIMLEEKPDGSMELRVKKVTLTVRRGDITRDRSDAIVNSTNERLSLNQGAVSQAILNAGGGDIQNECNEYVRHGELQHEFVRTKSGRLPCKYIYHLVANNTDWGTRIQKLLKAADKDRIKSMAFPALGTGDRTWQPEHMANIMLDEVVKFGLKGNPSDLYNISFIMFDDHVFNVFKDTLENKQKEKGKKAFFQSAKQFLGKIFLDWDWGSAAADADEEPEVLSPSEMQNCVVRIHAMSQSDIDHSIQQIDQHCQQQTITHAINSEEEQALIAKLDQAQKEQMQDFASGEGIRIVIEQKSRYNRITLEGHSKAVLNSSAHIRSILQDIKHNEVLLKQVHWEYDSGDSGMQSYPPNISILIEKAHQSGETAATWDEEDDSTFKVLFAEMVEVKNDDMTDRVPVRRMITGADSVTLPGSWVKMPPNSGSYHKEPLIDSSSEYKKVATNFQKTCPSAKWNIVRIERVQSPDLYQSYMVKHKYIKEKSPTADFEKLLWHGTSEDTIPGICRNGFNRGYCGKNAVYFGEGVYFAINAAYSATDTYSRPDGSGNKYMFQCRVLTGQFTVGKEGMRVLPPIDPNKPDVLYDSLVDKMNTANLHVIFHDSQAYPEYLVVFKAK